MKIFMDFIFFYFLNFVIIFWIEKYFITKISRTEIEFIIFPEINLLKRNRYHYLLKIFFNVIFLLIAYLFLYIFVAKTFTFTLSFIFLILLYIFFLKIRNTQICFHQEIVREIEILLFASVVIFCSLYALNYVPTNNSSVLKILIFLISLPALFVLNGNNINREQLHYLIESERIVLESLNTIFFTFVNLFFIFYFLGKTIDLITLSIHVFVFRIFLYLLNIVFVSFSKNLIYYILSVSFSLIILINILIKYVIR